MTLRDFEQHVVRCYVVKKEFSEKKHIMEAISGLAIKANKLRDYLDLTSDYGTEGILNVVSDYEKKAIREALGEVLFDFVYLYETLGIPIEEIMDATEGGME
jgi:NTP pyrophosphatase (non-canonical NTP hydrolase)